VRPSEASANPWPSSPSTKSQIPEIPRAAWRVGAPCAARLQEKASELGQLAAQHGRHTDLGDRAEPERFARGRRRAAPHCRSLEPETALVACQQEGARAKRKLQLNGVAGSDLEARPALQDGRQTQLLLIAALARLEAEPCQRRRTKLDVDRFAREEQDQDVSFANVFESEALRLSGQGHSIGIERSIERIRSARLIAHDARRSAGKALIVLRDRSLQGSAIEQVDQRGVTTLAAKLFEAALFQHGQALGQSARERLDLLGSSGVVHLHHEPGHEQG
jgi:GNAT superfamily N-acetyltransferase